MNTPFTNLPLSSGSCSEQLQPDLLAIEQLHLGKWWVKGQVLVFHLAHPDLFGLLVIKQANRTGNQTARG